MDARYKYHLAPAKQQAFPFYKYNVDTCYKESETFHRDFGYRI